MKTLGVVFVAAAVGAAREGIGLRSATLIVMAILFAIIGAVILDWE